MIKIENLSQPYGLNDVSCTIPEGKLVGIMGANGAGKSTLLKTIAGILSIARGVNAEDLIKEFRIGDEFHWKKKV